MPTQIDFRDCVHQGVAGPTPDHILASIRAEYCMPRASLPAARRADAGVAPVIQLEDFTALALALGAEAFRQLTADVLRWRDPGATLAQLPEFLSRHRYGQATPALVDLAKLDLAMALSDRAPAARSIGACCLPPDLLQSHPDLVLGFHPAWRWLDLAWPADQWRAALLAQAAPGATPPQHPAPHPVRLRLFPRRGTVAVQRMTATAFAFERALRSGAALRQAQAEAAGFDAVLHLQALLMEGAIIGVQLHPQGDRSSPDAQDSDSSSPLQPHEVTS